MSDWKNSIKAKLRGSVPYAFSADGSSAPVLSEEEFDDCWDFLCTEFDELLKRTFMLGHLIAGSDIVEALKLEGIEIDDFNESLDRHYSEIKWQEVKKTI